jgi:hypothetical protein
MPSRPKILRPLVQNKSSSSEILTMLRPLGCLALLLTLAGCGSSAETPLEPAPIAELQGGWRMINRSADCHANYARFAPDGLYRVYADQRPRKKYMSISKFTLAPGKIRIEATGLSTASADVASIVFSLADGKLRLVDMLGPGGASFATPPDRLPPAEQTYLKDVFRIAEQRFAMDRCQPG